MPRYQCKLGRSDGNIEEKTFESIDADTLRMSLEDKGYAVLNLRERKGLSLDVGSLLQRKALSSKEFLIFNQEFLTLIKAGMPILNALDLISHRVRNPQFKSVLLQMKQEIKAGLALSDAAGRHPSVFTDLYVATLRSGEKSGSLVVVLGRYVRYYKKMMAVRGKVISALTYPAFLLLILGALLAFLLLYIVPTFSSIYADFKGSIPAPTRILMELTTIGKDYFLLFLMAAIAGSVSAVMWYKTENGRLLFDAVKVKAPFVGKVMELYAISQFARTLGSLLSGGVPPVNALEMAAVSLPNKAMSRHFKGAVSRVKEGITMSVALEQTGVVPEMTVRMIEVGESSGSLEEMLGDIADFYEDEIETRLTTITSLVEPVLLLVMGLIIGGIVIVMYLPIFNLAGTVQ